MQVRDLIEQLQQFDPRSSVSFEVSTETTCGECDGGEHLFETTLKECEVKRGADTARIVLEG